jgi:hypothetical protein
MTTAAQEKIETYLGTLRTRLRGLGNEEVNDIVEELRSHVLEKSTVKGELAAREVDAVIEALGNPQELASEYITHAALARAEVSRSPFQILAGLFRWASLSVAGFFVLVSSLIGYFLGVAFILCALLKPIHPQSAGLWSFRNSSRRTAGVLKAWIWERAGGRPRHARVVDGSGRARCGFRASDANYPLRDLVRAAVPEIAGTTPSVAVPVRTGPTWTNRGKYWKPAARTTEAGAGIRYWYCANLVESR